MAIPTIDTISPTSGSPTGGQLVSVVGTNFRLPTPAGPEIPAPPAPPSVRVRVGGTEVTPWVVSSTRLLFPAPKRSMPVDSNGNTLGTEAVDVVVENIDDSGVLIPGETVTAVGAFTYQRPSIGYDNIAGITQVTGALIDLLRNEVLGNTVLDTSPDFDPDTATATIEVQSTPQLIVTGPDVTFNAFFTYRGAVLKLTGAEGHRVRRPRVVDLAYEIIGVTNSTVEMINLVELVEKVVDHNTTITANVSGTAVELEMRWVTDPQYERQPADPGLRSNLRVFRGSLQLRGYPMTSLPGDQAAVLEVGYAVDEVILDAPAQIGENLPTVHGAPTRSPGDEPLPDPSLTPHGLPTRSPPDSGDQ